MQRPQQVLLGAGHRVPGAAEGEVGGDAEDAGVRGAGDGPVAAAQQAAGAAGDRPVGGEVDADEEVARAGDVEGEALAADPEVARRRAPSGSTSGSGSRTA